MVTGYISYQGVYINDTHARIHTHTHTHTHTHVYKEYTCVVRLHTSHHCVTNGVECVHNFTSLS